MASNDQKFALLEDNIGIKEPVHLAQAWFDEALANPKILFPKAMCLSTASKSGIPSSRMVLLNDISDRGFTFFTNYGSHKAQEIEENSYVAVTLFWPPNSTQIRQLRVEGKAEKISWIESEKNFHQRPRAVQIGTLSCPQSTRIPSRQYLEQLDRSVEEEFAPDKEIPLPNWGGYLIVPHLIEFGQGEGHRMHDRIQFRKIANPDGETDGELVHKGANGWVYERLAP